MDFTKIMQELETNQPEYHKVIQQTITDKNEENKSLRQKSSSNNEILTSLLTQLGVEDVKRVPEVITNKSSELAAIIEQRKEDRKLIDELIEKDRKNSELLGKSTIISDLTKKFKSAGFKDPEYQAELYAEKTKKGETGLLVGDKFVDDVIKNLGVEKPYLLDKEIQKSTTTNTDGITETPKTKFSIEEIESMDDETLNKNMDAILAQKEEI